MVTGAPVTGRRQIGPSWLEERDLILAMDRQNLRALLRMAAAGDRGGRNRGTRSGERIRLLRSFDPASPAGAEVPDPYLGDDGAFAHVLVLIEAAAKELAARLAEMLAPRRADS